MILRTLKSKLLASALVAAAAPFAFAQETPPTTTPDAELQMPQGLTDNAWISLSGTVKSPTEQTFLLDYGASQIIVEVDDADGFAKAMALKEGSEVTVTGRVDKDVLETATIEASAVVEKVSGEHYFASPIDEEDLTTWFETSSAEAGDATMRGVVKNVNAEEGEFVLDNGAFEVQVDTGKLASNPFSSETSNPIAEGDLVTVSGYTETDLFESREFQATTLVVVAAQPDAIEKTAEILNEGVHHASVEKTLIAIAEGDQPGHAEKLDDEAAEQTSTAQAVAEGALKIEAELPAEVEAVSAKAGYTTEDLAKAQLAAIQSAGPLNPS